MKFPGKGKEKVNDFVHLFDNNHILLFIFNKVLSPGLSNPIKDQD